MSISITTNGYSNYVVQNQTANKVQNLQSNNLLGVNSDSLMISEEALAYLSSTRNTTILPSGNYTNNIRTEPLTIEEMSSYLSGMIERLSATNVDSGESESASKRASTIATLKETLAGVDLTSATNEEIKSLFTDVTNIFKEARPPREPHGLPPIEIMEGVTSTLSNEENRNLFSTILNQLTSSEDNAVSTLLKLQETLSSVDLTTSTNEDVDFVFNIVLDALDESWLLDNQASTSIIFESAEDLTTEEKKSFLNEIISSFQLTEDETNTNLL
ncbi:hypothetical protein ACFFHF_06425 [Robertmurraya beringensis]|uniref:Uncharacterized protein n=1 Tax=Robertmurraya beringensis TaxID=641660 RepID=A0ABV6KNK7_9BACI